MGMITRVRGRLHSITKLDPQIKDEKIAETVCLLSVLFLLPYCGRGHAPLLLGLGGMWLATYSCLVLPVLISANYKYPVRWLRNIILYLPDILFYIFYNVCSILNYLLPVYVIVDNWENAYLEHTSLHTIINQLLFFTMCDILFSPSNSEKSPHHSVVGLNSLLIYYVITFFVKRVVDIFFSFKKTQQNQPKNKSLLLCILKIVLEWAKAVIIIICLREQGLPPQPNIFYTFITFTYYFCTESVFSELFQKLLQLINLEKIEGLEILYAPVILSICNLSLCLILSTCLYFKSYIRLATFIFYHAIILNYKNAKTKSWELLLKELDVISMFRLASKREIQEWNDICPICLQNLDRARITQCNHLFHADCLRKCLKISNKCPFCKTNIFPDTQLQI